MFVAFEVFLEGINGVVVGEIIIDVKYGAMAEVALETNRSNVTTQYV